MNSIRVICLYYVIANGAFSENPSEISSRTLQVLVGEKNIKLDCLVVAGNDVAWYHVNEYNEYTQLSINKTTTFEQYFELAYYYELKTHNYCLIIKQISRNLEGLYICKLTYKSVVSTVAKTNIEVYELPTDPKIICGIETTDLVEGNIVTLNYTIFIGDVPANVTIFMVDTKGDCHAMYNLPNSQLSLEISVTRNMTRFHFRVSHNFLQPSLVCDTPQLNVKYSPRFESMMPSTLEYNRGDGLNIPINVTNSYPAADISWNCWRNINILFDCSQAELMSSEIPGIYNLSIDTSYCSEFIMTLTATNALGKDVHNVSLNCSYIYNKDNRKPLKVSMCILCLLLVVVVCGLVYRYKQWITERLCNGRSSWRDIITRCSFPGNVVSGQQCRNAVDEQMLSVDEKMLYVDEKVSVDEQMCPAVKESVSDDDEILQC